MRFNVVFSSQSKDTSVTTLCQSIWLYDWWSRWNSLLDDEQCYTAFSCD